MQLDADQSGLLSREELAAFRGGTLSAACVDRIFEECTTYRSGSGASELDFKGFLDVVLAFELRSSRAAQRFLFRLLDVGHRGALGLAEVRFLFQHVADRLAAFGHEAVDVSNVCDEVFDMLRPRRAGTIALADLLRSNMGGTACGILLDSSAFLLYDRREELRALGGGADGADGMPAADAEW